MRSDREPNLAGILRLRNGERSAVTATLLLLLVLGAPTALRELACAAARNASAAADVAANGSSERAWIRPLGDPEECDRRGGDADRVARLVPRFRRMLDYAWPPPRAPGPLVA